MIYVTHDQVEAMTLGERIVVLRGGDVMQYATPLELYNHPANRFVAGFIGTPPMNFLPGQIQQIDNGLFFMVAESDGQIPLVSATQQAALSPYAGKSVTLGIRAEHLTMSSVDAQSVSLTVMVDAVENMGNEALVYVTLGSSRLVARVSPTNALLLIVGQPITLHMDVMQGRFFDDTTEQAIC
jgi:multiple sugar transport system ATP-binding protein